VEKSADDELLNENVCVVRDVVVTQLTGFLEIGDRKRAPPLDRIFLKGS
jgi:hypothetical protein